jgi:hypothetical protein
VAVSDASRLLIVRQELLVVDVMRMSPPEVSGAPFLVHTKEKLPEP